MQLIGDVPKKHLILIIDTTRSDYNRHALVNKVKVSDNLVTKNYFIWKIPILLKFEDLVCWRATLRWLHSWHEKRCRFEKSWLIYERLHVDTVYKCMRKIKASYLWTSPSCFTTGVTLNFCINFAVMKPFYSDINKTN